MNQEQAETFISEEELDWLDEILLNRFPEDDDDRADSDEGIIEMPELDGYFTAILSGPKLIEPSDWIAGIWGDYEPAWKDDAEFEKTIQILMGILTSVAFSLSEEPEMYAPLFPEVEVSGEIELLVDEWCLGYMRGMGLCIQDWQIETEPMMSLLMPIFMFGSDSMTELQESLGRDEIKALKQQIAPNVIQIFEYRAQQRETMTGMYLPDGEVDPTVLPEFDQAFLQGQSEAEFIRLMMDNSDRVPRNVIDACASRGDAMVDALLPMADANEGEPFESEGRWWMRLHAIMILGLIPGEKAGMAFFPFIDYLTHLCQHKK